MARREPSAAERAQLAHWERQTRRRHPSHPVIAAFVAPKVAFLLEHMDTPRRARVLDVGCGNGYFTYYLARHGWVAGLDYSRTMLGQNPCPNLVQASAFALPFVDSSFDLVFCSNLLHHLEDPGAAVAEMMRVSCRYVALSEPSRNNPLLLAFGIVRREERRSLRFTACYLRSLAEGRGLRIVACQTAGYVTPNLMPGFLVRLLAGCTRPSRFGAYTVLLADKAAAGR